MPENASFQRQFQSRRGHLHNPHVRDLAWLLDAPDLLDAGARQWGGQIATLFAHQGVAIDEWLIELDDDPSSLQALVARHGFNRLGRYSELLTAFFLEHIGALRAHGLQVRAAGGQTVGEFDFLLDDPGARLVHWEFATKFYLLESADGAGHADALVGPNLADTLGAKMRKILERQLALGRHPAARNVLNELPVAAQALIKGWLFYRHESDPAPPGVNPQHCRGFWRPMASLDALPHERYLILPRLRWLAPARAPLAESLGKGELRSALEAHFSRDSLPAMLAPVVPEGDHVVEVGRGFIVPDDWHRRARQFVGK